MNENVESVRCLSVRRPWANLIVAGYKLVENRSWSTGYRGRLVIHAGKTFDQAGAEVAAGLAISGMDSAQWCASGYLGSVVLDDVHPSGDCCTWFGDPTPGGYHWVLSDPIAFATPVPGRGRLNLYGCEDPDLLAALAGSLGPEARAPQINPIVQAAAEQVANSKRRRARTSPAKDVPRCACRGQLSLFEIPGVMK
ncbi:ASCH domain-containing protein [Nocardia jiangxiensis]|uniref:ASCH domain-containing protein n=1 Tax=Nocardia jiangxiensis TaxID=282685 RepID=UPI0002E76A4F|nr:ASCH domain-containing protein [Nocardia jiangxiensis]